MLMIPSFSAGNSVTWILFNKGDKKTFTRMHKGFYQKEYLFEPENIQRL